MPSRMRHLPNQLTMLRLLLVPLLWGLALLRLRTPLGIGIAVAGLTDVLDGFIARRIHGTSRRGSQLDSVADMTLITSILIWLILLRPDFFRDYAVILTAWAALGLLTLLVGWIRFHRFANLHLWSAKAAGSVGYIFALYMLMLQAPAAPFFWLVIALAFVGTGESLLLLLTRRRVDEHAGTIFRASRR